MEARLLGETAEEFELERSETVRDTVLSLATQARRGNDFPTKEDREFRHGSSVAEGDCIAKLCGLFRARSQRGVWPQSQTERQYLPTR